MSGKVIVVASGKKFKVLVDYIQRGPLYSTKALADSQAKKVAEQTC